MTLFYLITLQIFTIKKKLLDQANFFFNLQKKNLYCLDNLECIRSKVWNCLFWQSHHSYFINSQYMYVTSLADVFSIKIKTKCNDKKVK